MSHQSPREPPSFDGPMEEANTIDSAIRAKFQRWPKQTLERPVPTADM